MQALTLPLLHLQIIARTGHHYRV